MHFGSSNQTDGINTNYTNMMPTSLILPKITFNLKILNIFNIDLLLGNI